MTKPETDEPYTLFNYTHSTSSSEALHILLNCLITARVFDRKIEVLVSGNITDFCNHLNSSTHTEKLQYLAGIGFDSFQLLGTSSYKVSPTTDIKMNMVDFAGARKLIEQSKKTVSL